MSKRVKACCVPGCTNKQLIRHSIPTNEDICRIWLQRINNPKLMRADTVLSSHRICDIHFEPICRNPNGRLKKLSLPTLHLPGYEKDENDIFWVQEQPSSFSTPKRLVESIARTSSSISTFTGNSPIEGTKKPVKVYTRKRLFQALVEEPYSSSSMLYEPSILTNMETDKLEGHSAVTEKREKRYMPNSFQSNDFCENIAIEFPDNYTSTYQIIDSVTNEEYVLDDTMVSGLSNVNLRTGKMVLYLQMTEGQLRNNMKIEEIPKCEECKQDAVGKSVINCDKGCGKLFHISCVQISRQNLDLLKMIEGVTWLCKNCRNK
ncbi:uncharacterized protein LOC130442182 isoform X2 [Diorhabda sublineata]|uniref:uncharacterized protein LOC130442182 isoform X2 n=1 Tax=Diorhabda sublineata TaxID=1163346 RepID=UPI0024E1391F|nr:uncharacterized protein LOC130442182 isoform X2 [Diorhabda sublineata]